MMGAGWDWSREVVTCLPDYYKWTQWLFLQFYKHGLAYRTKAPANWCPSCNTTLANEQVLAMAPASAAARSSSAERSTSGCCASPLCRRAAGASMGIDWPEKTMTMQRNWIGRSEGAEIRFVATEDRCAEQRRHREKMAPVFTTRPDTIYGVTFFVLAPEHPLVEQITTPEQRAAVRAYVEQARAHDRDRAHEHRAGEDRRLHSAAMSPIPSAAHRFPSGSPTMC